MKEEVIWKEAKEAEKRISLHISETPLEYSHYLSQESGSNVSLKLDNFQITKIVF
jgi:threonine dehydratase